ncbi:MAG TPA: hydantoinase/oxoprolinase family protein, partial [Paracoccaceae bacterium]|nr:hydantoinase/oxoprolinase family protein [Paracoccaceae bacterium]
AHGDFVDGFAVVAHFGTRNPEDEEVARTDIIAVTGLPVTCGHDLSAALNGPKRALTAVLNARLIGMIAGLIAAAESMLSARGINAPLMLVRGDGSLVAGDFARARPIETILSGPAASLVGAAHLTGLEDAVVSDIGGTTTDIGLLGQSRPSVAEDGASVGGHRTMVQAVDMSTHGLGGDSEVQVDDRVPEPCVMLGPRRVIPISLIAAEHESVLAALERQLGATAPRALDARFLLPGPGRRSELKPAEIALLEAIGDGPVAADRVLRSRALIAALDRLVARGVVRVAGFTPSDAAHVLGRQADWDAEAAAWAATLMARKRDATGRPVAATPEEFAHLVHRTLIRHSAEAILDAALARDGHPDPHPSRAPLARAALDGHHGAARISIGLAYPLIGLGASAPVYYPEIAALLGTEVAVPAHSDVANAVGAVVGRVRITRTATVTQPELGIFRAHLPDGTADFEDLDSARAGVMDALSELAASEAREAGAAEVELSFDWSHNDATVEGKPLFVEAHAAVTATGRPRLG